MELVATPTSIPANGTTITTLVATVEDANGNPVPAGIPVSWTTTNGALSNASTVTDAAGKTTVTLKGTVAGNASVKASAVAGFETADVMLFADNTTAKIVSLVATPASITANGTDSSTLVATLQDAHGNAVTAGASVAWTTSSGTLSGATSTTDASGKASITLKGTVAGSAAVKATAAVGSQTATVTLVADNATAKVVSLVATPTTITANDADNSVLVATVQDAHGNPVPAGVSVAWTTSSGMLSGASSTTDASGKATISLKGTTAGAASVKASAAAGAATATVTLVADNASAKIVKLVATPAWGCTPESQKFPSAQLQSRHERIQVDELAVSLEGVMPVQQDVPPGRWRHLRDQRQRLGIASCLVLRQQQGQDRRVVEDDRVADQPGALVADLDFDVGAAGQFLLPTDLGDGRA